MSTVERINLRIQQMPLQFQTEVLNFVEFLSSKIASDDPREEELQWSHFSIAQAMRGLEDEETPVYDESDLKEKWQ